MPEETAMATNWNAILSNTNNLQDVLSILKKVLAQLDIKVDETTVDEALAKIQSLDADVNEKLGVLAQELTDFEIEKNQAFQDLLNSGGFRPFPTEVDLKAYTPTTSPVAAYAFDTKKVCLWNGSAWIDEGTSALDVAKDYSDQKTSDSNQLIAKKLNATFDFYTFNIYPSIIEINEAGQVLGTGTTTIELTANLALSQAEYLSQYQKYNQLNIFDFYTYSSFPDFIQINDSNQIIGTGTTEKDIYTYDFYTFSEYPDLLFVDSKMKVLNASSSNDFDKLPDSEADANSLYFNENTLKRVRAYSSMYNQLNAEVIPDFQAQRVYDFFDNLMSNNPSYITKSSLGFSTRGVEMFTYKFTPPSRRVGNGSTLDQIKPVRIMMNAGIHGSEKHGIIATMCFADNLVNNWRELEHYDVLRLNCEFYISPMMNIDGTNYNTRTNANGVDCNRNFDWNWSTADNSINKGSAPFSEIESRNYRDLVLNSNCDAYLDIHHGGENEIIWLGSNIDENLKLLSNAATEITTHFLKNINPSVDPQTQLVYLPRNGDGTACGWMCANNKSGFLCEGIGTGNPYILTTLNARKVNETVLLKVVNQIFNRVTLRKELSI